MRVNPHFLARRAWFWPLFVAVLLAGAGGAWADQKVIRLRNELITTTPADPATIGRQAVETPVTGLFVLQFTDKPQPAWVEELRNLNVSLLRYVPEDAFVVRLAGTRLNQLRKLPFVQWVGEYKPTHKLHSVFQLLGRTNGPVPVRVLLAPDANEEAVRGVKASLQKLTGEAKSGFGVILSGDVLPAQVNALAQSPSILWMEPARKMKLSDEIATKIVAGGDAGDPARPNLADVHALGYDGRDVIVAVADSGLNNGDADTMHPDLAGRVDAFFFYRDLEDAADEHSHGTHVTGIIAGDGATGEADESGALYGLGVAPKAHIVAQRVFDADGVDKLPAYDVLTRDAVRAGAVIGSNSWGDDSFGRYDLSAAQFDALVRDADPVTPGEQPYILEFSAGNSGPGAQTINTPAVAKNVIATGASQNNRFEFPIYAEGQESMADFSSRGPCEDGRIKPDVVAPGTWIASLQSESATDQFAWEAISPNYQFQGGTSQAGPHVSGCAAIFVQYYRQNYGGLTPSPAMVKAALINSAVDMGTAEITIPGEEDEEDPSVIEVGDTGPAPNNDEGWGRVDLTQIIGSTRVTEYLDQTTNLITGRTYERRVVVASRDEPLKITLTYTDVPGLPAAIPALVNDLDLEVVAPDGSLYRGNQFFNGESVAGVPVGDSVNNVEGVLINEPAPGEWLVRVRARNVVEDIHHRTNQAPEQDFALVVSGDFPPAGAAVLFFDRDAYRLPVTAQVRLIDSDLAGQTSVTLKVTSTTEPAGETLILRSTGTPGVFTNGIALVEAGVVANDGRLQVTNETTIRVAYQDVNPQLERVAIARVDSKPPIITDVIVTNRLGKVIIEWTTDEPANSVARFGTGGNLTQGLTNTALVSRHSMPLPPLTVGQTNQFLVISTDAAGNTTTNDNGGKFYTFVPRKGKPVLLVYATDSLFDLPPIDTYTSTLDVLGIEYDLWNLEEKPSPTADDLHPFDVVIWRVQELNLEGQTLTAPMQAAISGYVTNGGSVLMASMELCSRLTTPQDIAFRKGILHVEDFVTDAGATFVDGTTGDIIGDGLHLELDYSTYPDLFGFIVFEDLPDHLTISSNAAPIFREADTGQIVGLRYPKAGQDSVGRVVFCSFAMEAVSDAADAPNNRVTVLADILKFLSPSLQSTSGIEFDSAAYTVPARATVELTDVNRAGSKQLEVTISSTSEAGTQKLILDETARQGVFRGVIALVPVNSAAGAGRLRVKEADVIEVTYLDPTVNREIHASAIIDTVPPQITDVTSEPDYNETVVRWSSSKPADALVRFGETDGDPTFLNRTAYSGDFSTEHELLLTGLLPDRDYYFQVISRDAAGNAGVAGQQGSLFKFRTLKPIVAPWSDNFENGRNGWVVLNDDTVVDDETGENLLDAGWRLGQPANSLASTAHSGNNAWGTNLRDESATFAISDLVSPAIELKTGNRATLRFWQMYDFQEKSEFLDLQAGIVAVTTNNGALWTTVYTPSDELVADWEEVEVDLSAYLGKVIRISFHYELFSFDVDEHPGWMIDDISISLTNSPVGNLTVTNNLAQAAFTVVGPVSYTGKGQLFQVTNAPPGEYRVAWSAVPYYNTPPSQTNSVNTNGPLVFTGNYTFADANNNGMSDAWEQAFFGGVSPTRTRQTDSDGDGLTDYAEFIAGTNPVDAGAFLELGPPELRANRTLSFSWPATPGRVYRLEGSLDLKTWEAYSDWIPASGNTASVILPPLDLRFPYFFRLQVRP